MICSETTFFLSVIKVGQSVLLKIDLSGIIMSVDFGADRQSIQEVFPYSAVNEHLTELFPHDYRLNLHDLFRKASQTEKFASDTISVSEAPLGVTNLYKIVVIPVLENSELYVTIENKGRKELTIRDSNTVLREFINESPVMLHVVDNNGIITWASKYWLKATGYSRDEVLGKHYYDFFTEDSKKKSREVERPRLMKEGAITNVQYQYIHKSGKRMDVLISAHVERNRHGKHKRIFAVVKDITDLKTTKRELLRQKIALDEAAIVVITDRMGNITYVNDKFCEISKYSREELIGQNHRLIKSDEHSREFFKTMWKTITGGKVWKGEVKNRAKDGTFYWMYTTIVPFMDDNGRPYRFLAIRMDITKRKKLEHEILIQNEHLEELVDARTLELHDQTAETLAAFEKVKKTGEDLRQKNQYILDGINYAKRIQKVLLPQEETFKKIFSEAFVLFKPKDLVSGDFYCIEKIGHQVLVAAVDCTGHGVPGGFMSMIGSTLIRKIIRNKRIYHPAAILDELHDEVITALNQNQSKNRDGMDISLCLIDKQKKVLHFAAANHSLYMMNGGEKAILKGDRRGIGGVLKNKRNKRFAEHHIKLRFPTTLYMFSDGFADQFGGPRDRKFMVRQFRELIFENADLPMEEQHELFDKTLTEWQGCNDQTDDILLIGLRLAGDD